MSQLHIKPKEDGAYVPRPDQGNRALRPDGEHVPDNSYYRRRIACGDVVEVKVEINNEVEGE